MTKLERMEAFWAGERPDMIPLSIYRWFLDGYQGGKLGKEPLMQKFTRECELIATDFFFAFGRKFTTSDIEFYRDEYDKDGSHWIRTGYRTPVGEVFELFKNDWRQKHLLVDAADYRVMTYIVEHTEFFPDFENFKKKQAKLHPSAVSQACLERSPMQTILVDFTGLENFAMHLFECADEMQTLYQAMLKNFRRQVEITVDAPTRYVEILENFTAETMGPQRYAEFHMPVYKELIPQLQRAGKVVGVHYDGKISSCKDLIAQAPFDLIESLTEPPEGDMTLKECRAAWPKKLFWSNINVNSYELPDDQLRKRVLQLVADGSDQGRRLAFELSEDVPAQWATKIPVILSALEETRR